MTTKERVKLKLSIITIFGMAMGWLEAVTVIYIRKVLSAEKVIDLTKVVIEQANLTVIRLEQTREATTLIMLVTLSLVAGRTFRERLGIFLWVFAIWDIFYYLVLKLLINWPPSLTTIDCLFLIPVPWIAPVYVPIMLSVMMLIISVILWRKKSV